LQAPGERREPLTKCGVLPTAIGPYRILEEVARGGAGLVLRAQDPGVGREVAIKVLNKVREELAKAAETSD